MTKQSTIDSIVSLIPEHLLDENGCAFVSGRDSFAEHPLMILGANPSGDPDNGFEGWTIRFDTDQCLHHWPASYNGWRDGHRYPDGKVGFWSAGGRRVVHLIESLGYDPGEVPCAQLVFVRSPRLEGLNGSFEERAEECWPVHAARIAQSDPTVITFQDVVFDLDIDESDSVSALTDGKTKYIFHARDGQQQLFDLVNDPGEEREDQPAATGPAHYRGHRRPSEKDHRCDAKRGHAVIRMGW